VVTTLVTAKERKGLTELETAGLKAVVTAVVAAGEQQE